MLTFGLMSRSHETMAMRTSGLDILQLLRPVSALTGGVMAVMLALNLYLIPWSQGSLNNFWQSQVEKKPARNLQAMEHFWYKGDQAIYNILLFRKDIQTMEGVKIYLFDRQFHLVQVIAAARAQFQGGSLALFPGADPDPGVPAAPPEGRSSSSGTWSSRSARKTFADLEKKVTEMDFNELAGYVGRLERDGYKSTPYRVDLYSRLSLALTPLIMVILGLALALRHNEIHLTSVVALGMGLMFVYWLFFGFSASFGQAGRWPRPVAVSLPAPGFRRPGPGAAAAGYQMSTQPPIETARPSCAGLTPRSGSGEPVTFTR